MKEKKESKNVISSSDYYVNSNGNIVFTAAYLRKRGYCCKNGCTHCPYGNK
jgi:hypothetical protein